MKILLMAPQPFFQHRGTPIAVRLLCQVLGTAGHQVRLLCYAEGTDIWLPNVRIHRIPKLPGLTDIRPGFSLKKLGCDLVMGVSCMRLLRRERFDLIHAVEESAFIALLMRYLFHLPFIYDMDSCLSDQLAEKYPVLEGSKGILEFLEGAMVRRSLGVVAVCRYLEETARRFGFNKALLRLEDISLLDQGEPTDESLRKRFGIQGLILMYVGNLERYQGTDLLLEAFALASEQAPLARLVVIGGSPDHIRAYQRMASRLGISQSAFFIGPRPVSQLGAYLAQADILLSPRIQGKNTPMKIYSYLDADKPLLATRLPTHTQVLDDEISLLTDPNPEAMAKGMLRLIEDEKLRKRLARQAKQRVQAEFCHAAFQRKLLGFYQGIQEAISGHKEKIL